MTELPPSLAANPRLGDWLRAVYLRAAAARWDLPVATLTVSDGTIFSPNGPATSYWELRRRPARPPD